MPGAIVTGCLGAIGSAVCADLSSDGFRVVGIDLTEGASVAHGDYLSCNLADSAAVETLLHELRSGFSCPTVLVNNAAHYESKPFFATTMEDFDRTFSINARAVFQLSQGVARWMVEQRVMGSIVNIASIAGKLGSPIVAYGASKAAVIGLTRSMAKVLATEGIRVNAVAPGVVSSRMSDAIAPEQMRIQLAQTPMARLGEPDEIAKVVSFLAGASSSYMTGSIVDVAGGWMS